MRPIPVSSLTRLEFIGTVPFSANTAQQLNTQGGNLPLEKHLWGIVLTVRGRATMPATGGPSALTADGPYAIINGLTVEGYHRPRAQTEKFVDLPGADAYLLGKFYAEGPLPELPTSWSFSGSATNDFEFHVVVPFVPAKMSPLEQLNYVLDAPNYETLKLTVYWADTASMFGSYTTAPTLSAFGSASGSPECQVHGIFALGGANRFAGVVPGKVWRYFNRITDSRVTTSATSVRLAELPKGYHIRNISLKTGVLRTGTSAGNVAYNTYSDFLTEIKIMRGLNYAIRYAKLPSVVRAVFAIQRDVVTPVGWTIFDFAHSGLLGESLSTRDMIAGPSGTVDFFLQADVTGASNQALTVLIEEVRQLPVVATPRRR
jgi:hypothetical protein